MSASIHSISVVRGHSSSHSSCYDEDEANPTPSVGNHPNSDENETEITSHHQGNPSDDNPTIQNNPTILVNNKSVYSPYHVERIRRKLRFFFMNPIEKWQAKRRFPWKLLVQIFKIIVVTLQVALFGNARYSHISFYNDNTISFSHLFLRNWEAVRDIKTYPPALGVYAAYTKEDFYQNINYAVEVYANLHQIAVGSYDYANSDGSLPSMQFCKTFFKEGEIFGFNETFKFDNTVIQECLEIFPVTELNSTIWTPFNSLEYFEKNNFSLKFDRLIRATLNFSLKSILLRSPRPLQTPDCFIFQVVINYDNSNHNGQIKISLRLKESQLFCHGVMQHGDSLRFTVSMLDFLNIIVIAVSILSFVLCSRALFRAHNLKKEAIFFFKHHFGSELSINESLEFVNFWYVIIIINDILVILGSVLKIQIENKNTQEDLYNACSVLLGIGTLLVWFGLLRYLSFFPKYNILILTMRRAAPDVLRFLLCALLIYAGFAFNGWIILGPYHIKFQTLSSTSECLFSLINGDDMFATFAITLDKSSLIWWYSRIYFYSFISLFIYVVISLFIAVIMDSYDTIKTYYQHGFPKTFLMEFVSECVDDASSGLFKEDECSWKEFFSSLKFCSLCKRRNSLEHYEPI